MMMLKFERVCLIKFNVVVGLFLHCCSFTALTAKPYESGWNMPGSLASLKMLKGGYNLLTKCKSFTDAFIIQTCGNNRQLDYATPRSTNCACSAVSQQNCFNSA